MGIPIGSVISCSRTFYLQKTQQKTSSSCQSTLASPGLALLWNLVVIINYRDCPQGPSCACRLLHFPSSPALPRAKQSTQHIDGPNNLEAAPSTEGREEGTYRKADLRAARPKTACQELRASNFLIFLPSSVSFAFVVCWTNTQKGKSPIRTGTASPHRSPLQRPGCAQHGQQLNQLRLAAGESAERQHQHTTSARICC